MQETWYFRCCLCKWFGRNWYSGKTALEIAQFKVERERWEQGVDELDADHRYMQILELFEEDRAVTVGGVAGMETEVDLVVASSDTQVLGNSDAEQKHVEADHKCM